MKVNKIIYIFVAVFLLVGVFVSADIFIPTPPEKVRIDDGRWEVTHTTDYDYTPYLADLKEKKTKIGLIPNDGICPSETKQLYGRDNSLMLDDKNKAITLKCESSKCDGKNCYSITLTDAQAVNIDDYVKIGEESTIFEWKNSTLYIYNTDFYDREGFEIEIFIDQMKVVSLDIKWIEDNPTDNKIVFYPNLSNIIYPLDDVSFKVNKFIIPKARVSINPYYSVISNWVLDFSTFESKNEITNKTIETIYGEEDEFGFKEVLGYVIKYVGLIIDLDPVMQLIYNSVDDIVFNNITEGSTHGARIDALVLFMDFNKPPEILDDTTYINYSNDYVQDNSVYNNYGDRGNLLDDGMWVNGNFSGGLEFDNTNDYVVFNDGANSGLNFPLNNFSICYWIYDGLNSNVIIRKGGGYSTATPGYSIAEGEQIQISSTNKVIYNSLVGTAQLTTDTWQHFCFTFNRNGNVTKYVDSILIAGVNISADSSENISTTFDFLIGQSGLQTID